MFLAHLVINTVITAFEQRPKRFNPVRVAIAVHILLCHVVNRCVIELGFQPAISESVSWRDIRQGDMRAFLQGCNLDFCDTKTMRRTFDWLGKTTLNSYLQKTKNFDTRYFQTHYLPLLKRWYRSYGIVTKDSPIREPVRSLLIRLKPLLEKSDKPHEVPNITPAPEFP